MAMLAVELVIACCLVWALTTTARVSIVYAAPIAPTRAPVVAPVFIGEDHDKGLAWGRYNFTFPDVANNDSMFSLDVRDMWFSKSTAAAKAIYLNRSRYATNGLSRQSEVLSLQGLNTKASLLMSKDPMYNFYRCALFDDESFENRTGWDGGWPYADVVVESALGPTNGNRPELRSKAVVVLSIWITIAHKLYEAVRTCSQGKTAVEYIDSAVGLWIGQEQGEGKFNSGWSMYASAQEATRLYGNTEGEAKVNTNLMKLFAKAQSLAKVCTVQGQEGRLRTLVDDIVRTLSLPLLQHLLFHMSDNNVEYVELYAFAFMPQTISVDEGAFGYLRDSLFEGFAWNTTVTTDFISALGKVLYAMRITCADLGDTTSATEKLSGLIDEICDAFRSTYNSAYLADYETSFDVSELARLDIDVLQIDLFMRSNAKELAYSVYTKGRNSRKATGGFNTLQEIATRSRNGMAGELQKVHHMYFNTTRPYADEIIQIALHDDAFDNYSRQQQSENVRRTLQAMVVYLETESLVRASIEKCNKTSIGDDDSEIPIAGQEEVDQAVALYVGSIEGRISGGNPYGLYGSGQMMYALAKEICRPLNSCETKGDSEANAFLLFAFSQMKESLDRGDCVAAESVLQDDVLSGLLVPLVQGVLFFAEQNEGAPPLSTNASLVSGTILAETLLPQLAAVDQANANVVYENMDYDVNEIAVKDGKEAVFDAFTAIVDKLNLNCKAIGTSVSSNLSVCSDSSQSHVPTPNSTTAQSQDPSPNTTATPPSPNNTAVESQTPSLTTTATSGLAKNIRSWRNRLCCFVCWFMSFAMWV
jgi:hypothetical protein